MKYRVRPGILHGAQRQYKPGDVLELTEQEAAGFLDKLELVPDEPAAAAAPVVPVAEPDAEDDAPALPKRTASKQKATS